MAEVIIVRDAREAGEFVADAVIDLVRARPSAVLGLATGSSPLPVYDAIGRRAGEVDLSRVHGFALDEYVGLPEGHEQSYRATITREVVVPLGLTPANVHVPCGRVEGIRTAGEEYDTAIAAAGGIDLQLLGIGTDGHIGFNEPGSSFASPTRVKTLTRQTRRDNSRFFGHADEVPRRSITQGIGTILRARHLVLLAFGESKAQAVASAVEGPLTSSVPASAIQLHPRATVVIDEAASRLLANADYYRDAFADSSAWQTR